MVLAGQPDGHQRRAHPYHGTTGNRCADRRFPRSRPTVVAEVIGSLSAKLCVLSIRYITAEPTQVIATSLLPPAETRRRVTRRVPSRRPPRLPRPGRPGTGGIHGQNFHGYVVKRGRVCIELSCRSGAECGRIVRGCGNCDLLQATARGASLRLAQKKKAAGGSGRRPRGCPP